VAELKVRFVVDRCIGVKKGMVLPRMEPGTLLKSDMI
jgi:hypothetical protein